LFYLFKSSQLKFSQTVVFENIFSKAFGEEAFEQVG